MFIDYATGSATALRAGEWSPERHLAQAGQCSGCHRGWLDVVIGHLLTNLPGLELPFTYTVLLCSLVVIWYILTEVGCIIENTGALGAPVPGWLRKLIEALKNGMDEAGEKVQK